MTGSPTRLISLNELAEHTDKKDCWIAVHGVVMDITPFLNEHPGGPDVVVVTAGRDCTAEFEDAAHTDSARRLGDKYVIGRLSEDSPFCLPTNQEVMDMAKSSSLTNYVLAGALVAVVAAIYYIVVNK